MNTELSNLKALIEQSRSPALFAAAEDFLTERLLAHPAKNPLPSVSLSAHAAMPYGDRVHVAERLLAAYHRAMDNEENSPLRREGDDLWSNLLNSELSELVETLNAKDSERLATYLMEFGKSYTWFGGISTSIDGYNRNLSPQQVAISYLDKLVCLAEYVGALSLENPEVGPWGDNLHVDPESLIAGIEQALGIDISPPMGIIHTDGLGTKKGVFHYRHINSIYMAARIATLNPGKGGVCEFGGGLGMTAMYAGRLGCRNYTIFDLPLTCLLSGHYLIHAVGAENVALYGEEPGPNAIKVLPYWECLNYQDKGLEMALNQDGMPEMSDNFVFGYLKEIKRIARSHFLSMNHEYFAPRTVHNFVKQSGGFDVLYRFKSWTREGYLEECYKIK